MHRHAAKWAAVAVTFVLAFSLGALAVRHPHKPSPVPAYYPWNYRHAAFVERAKAGGIDVVFLGDSITDGWSDQPLWPDAFAPLRVADFGIAFDRCGDVLRRVREGTLDGSGARLVVLMIGSNDLAAGEAPSAVAALVAEVAEEIRRRHPSARLLILAILPRDSVAGISETNRMLRTRFTAFSDFGDLFAAAEMLADGIHPSPKGYAAWAPGLRDAIHRAMP
jgi:lysophospholipase L1-like esterase